MPVQSDTRSDHRSSAVPAGGAGVAPAGDEALRERLADVQRGIAAAADRVDRSPHAVTLVAVSKGFDVEAIRAGRRVGQSDFGESRAQELRRKSDAIGAGVRWHFVGRLQRNKVRDVVGTASLIHSVDRFELAQAISERMAPRGGVQRVLVQVNVGDDPAKGGCAIDETVGLVARVRGLDGIACEGLMTIPPMGVDPRPLFARLRELRDDLRDRFPEVQHLSMGMSGDFEIAVEEGATIVRVGEAIFGERPQRAD